MAKGDKAARPPALSEQMKRAWQLYEEGDKVRAREEARAVLAQPPSPLDAEQARELLQRTAPPHLVYLLAAAALALVLALVLLAVTRAP
jgi:hypothetical protein